MKQPTNLPREELLKRADAAIKLFEKEGCKAHVNFKFDCEKCGERCTLIDNNVLHEYGECHVCKHKTKIVEGGFSLTTTIGPL